MRNSKFNNTTKTIGKKVLGRIKRNSLYKKILNSLESENKYFCPLCDSYSKKLSLIGEDFPVLQSKKVIGAGKRYGGCINCGCTDRERLIYAYLKHEIELFSRKNKRVILHIAPERHIAEKIIDLNFHDYRCGDLRTEGYSYPDYVENISVLDIPYPEQIFDLVLCNHVLEHVDNDSLAIEELFRVLKPGGRAIIQVPISANSSYTVEDPRITDPKMREDIFGQYNHVRLYGQDYVKRLKSVGFNVKKINISAKFKSYGLNRKEDLYICERPLSKGLISN